MSSQEKNEKTDARLLDKIWRVSHLYKITTKNKSLIQFKRNRAQQHYNAHKAARNIILKSRQLGFTTDESIDSLDDTLFTRNHDTLIISYDQDSAYKIFDSKIRLAWNNFPLKQLYKVDAERADTLKVDFGDGTTSSIQVKTTGRSGTYHRVHISEFAKICKSDPSKAQEIITGTIPAVPIDGRVDIESTAEGEFGDFHDMFWLAWNRGEHTDTQGAAPRHPTEYQAHFYNWTWDDEEIAKSPILDDLPEEFLTYQKSNNLTDQQISYYYLKYVSLGSDWSRLRQEYPTTPEEAFATSGERYFPQEALEKMTLRPGEPYGGWLLYDRFHAKHRYAIGADPAEGVGRDSSAAIIWDFTTNEVVGEFSNNEIAPDLFAYELRDMGLKFGTCLIAVERNNHGHAVLQKLKEIYPQNRIFREVAANVRETETGKWGWHTGGASKANMLAALSEVIREGTVNIPSQNLLFELKTYDRDDLRIIRGNEKTKHWDLVMATCIGWQMNPHATESTPALKWETKPITFT